MVRGHRKQSCSCLVRKHETAVIRSVDEMNDVKGISGFLNIIRKQYFYQRVNSDKNKRFQLDSPRLRQTFTRPETGFVPRPASCIGEALSPLQTLNNYLTVTAASYEFTVVSHDHNGLSGIP